MPFKFASLRPASLPAPSAVRPGRPRPESARVASTSNAPSKPHGDADLEHRENVRPDALRPEDKSSRDPQETQILKLVAADVPSHRGAWKKEGKAWQSFIRRRGMESKYPIVAGEMAEEDEEAENEDWDDGEEESEDEHRDPFTSEEETLGIARSLPVAIHPMGSIARPAYEPKTSLADRPGIVVPPLRNIPPSSAAARRASYAERDIRRAVDPGALDFAAVEDEEEDEEEDEQELNGNAAAKGAGDRGRQRALKILQARSELPDEGMWRSLAS